MDRHAVHGTIREALNLENLAAHDRKPKNNVVLDAEMVAWYGNGVDGMCITSIDWKLYIDKPQSSGGFVGLLNVQHMASGGFSMMEILNILRIRRPRCTPAFPSSHFLSS